MSAGRCAECARVRPLTELLEVQDRRRSWLRWHICRPSYQARREDCFRAVGPASEYAIRLAVDARRERGEAV